MECFLVSLLNLEIFLVWNASIWVRLMATTWQRRGRRKSRDLQDGDKLARFLYFVYSFIWFHPLKYICVTYQANSDKHRVPWCWQGKNRTYVVDDYVHHSVFFNGIVEYLCWLNCYIPVIIQRSTHLSSQFYLWCTSLCTYCKPKLWMTAGHRKMLCFCFILFFSVQWHFHG